LRFNFDTNSDYEICVPFFVLVYFVKSIIHQMQKGPS
jgi:hypothetical protein